MDERKQEGREPWPPWGGSCGGPWSVAAEGPKGTGRWERWTGMWLGEERGEPAKPMIKRKGIWRQEVIMGLFTVKKLHEILVEGHGTPWVCSSRSSLWNRRAWGLWFHVAFAVKSMCVYI